MSIGTYREYRNLPAQHLSSLLSFAFPLSLPLLHRRFESCGQVPLEKALPLVHHLLALIQISTQRGTVSPELSELSDDLLVFSIESVVCVRQPRISAVHALNLFIEPADGGPAALQHLAGKLNGTRGFVELGVRVGHLFACRASDGRACRRVSRVINLSKSAYSFGRAANIPHADVLDCRSLGVSSSSRLTRTRPLTRAPARLFDPSKDHRECEEGPRVQFRSRDAPFPARTEIAQQASMSRCRTSG